MKFRKKKFFTRFELHSTVFYLFRSGAGKKMQTLQKRLDEMQEELYRLESS